MESVGSSNAVSPDETGVGKDAWKDRVEAEKQVSGWLMESPGLSLLLPFTSRVPGGNLIPSSHVHHYHRSTGLRKVGNGLQSVEYTAKVSYRSDHIVGDPLVEPVPSRQTLVIDCAEIARAKTDAALVNELANQTGERVAVVEAVGMCDTNTLSNRCRLLSRLLIPLVHQRPRRPG
jgi:hypothetical protein